MDVKRYELRIVDRYAGDGSGEIETHANMRESKSGSYVKYGDFDRVTAERDALQLRLNAVEEENDRLKSELGQCEAMASMVAEREWAEHVGTGVVSSQVESAFTALHSELQSALEKRP